MKILIIFGSTRTERNGEVVFRWVKNTLQKQPNLVIDAVDLRDVPLPFYDEPKSIDALDGRFNHKIGKQWNERISTADGFIMITPEYNHGISAVLKNAIDYAWEGWNYKPLSIVSYSTGMIAGARAAEQLRLIASGVKLLPLPTALHIPKVTSAFDESGQPTNEATGRSLDSLIREMVDVGSRLSR